MQKNEARTRYFTAAERARRAAHERNLLLLQLQDRIALTINTKSAHIAIAFDVDEADVYLKQAKFLNGVLLLAIHEANLYAEACEQPRLELGSFE